MCLHLVEKRNYKLIGNWSSLYPHGSLCRVTLERGKHLTTLSLYFLTCLMRELKPLVGPSGEVVSEAMGRGQASGPTNTWHSRIQARQCQDRCFFRREAGSFHQKYLKIQMLANKSKLYKTCCVFYKRTKQTQGQMMYK